MKYKAIIFDLDGTAIPNKPHGMPSKELIQAIDEYKHKIKLCAATGRPISNAGEILEALNLEHPCVISAGTQIINPKTREILWEANIEKEDVEKIIEICRPHHYEILVRNELLGEGRAANNRSIDDDINVMYIMQVFKNDAMDIISKLDEIRGITASSVLSWTQDGVDIHITNSEATKEHAVSELLKIIKVDKNETIGVGDADNDVHLFKSVGYKIAMGNATDRLKKLADEVTASVDDNGLVTAIKKYSR